MMASLLTLDLQQPHDGVMARQRARQIAGTLGFEAQDQTRLATAVSEVARNAFQYAGSATIEFSLDEQSRVFLIKIVDHGPGIKDVAAILDGRWSSGTGKSMGIQSVRRLMDHFHIESSPANGTAITFGKTLPGAVPTPRSRDLMRLADDLRNATAHSPIDEAREQNKELLGTLEELRQRQADLARANEELQRREETLSELNRELEDTNRGVVALYAELEEKAEFLGRASEMKSRFLSNMSHEFRTPLNAIAGLTRLLLSRIDGELTAEQEKQVSLIRRAAENLTELVNDLLDLAKVEAGKVVVRPSEFDLTSLFGGLRGMLRPLLSANSSVELIFEEPARGTTLATDESKVSQILRNFISNALKFTERGEIRVSALVDADDVVTFSVADTGIGIAPEDQVRIFDEYTQVEGPHQTRAKGTGLGLPLVRKLADLLGGRVLLKSALGKGSTFSVALPRVYKGPAEVAVVPEVSTELDPSRRPILFVEDNRETLFIYEKYLKDTLYQLVPAQSLVSARRALARCRPRAIVLDVLLNGESGWDFLAELKQSSEWRDIPVVMITLVENEAKAKALGVEAYCVKPVERTWLLTALSRLAAAPKVLLIDDDEASRYLLRESLKRLPFEVVECASGATGIERAHADRPSAIVLDLELPDLSGHDVLAALKSHPKTKSVPILINTSKILEDAESQSLLGAGAAAILSKARLCENGPEPLTDALRALGIIR